MKGLLILELFGENTREIAKVYRAIFNLCAGEAGKAIFDSQVGVPPRSSWVAEVTGPDEKYGLSRTFLRGKINYAHANGIGSRSVMAEYILSQGKIYEVKSQETWTRFRRYFCSVNDAGDIVELDEASVCHSMGVLTREERDERRRIKIAEIIGPDDQYLLARKFLSCDLTYVPEYENAPYPGYTLEPGKLYEVREQYKRDKIKRYFCRISDSGEVVHIDDVDAYHAVGALTKEERWKLRAEKLSRDKCP